MIVVNYLQEGMMSRDTKKVDVEKENLSGYTRHKNSKHPGHVFPKKDWHD